MSIYKINGGIANQPEVPTANFGRGRNDGWFNYSILNAEDKVYAVTPSLLVEDDREFAIFSAPKVGKTYDISLSFNSNELSHSELLEGVNVSMTSNGGLTPNLENPRNIVSSETGNGIVDYVTLSSPFRTVSIPFTGSVIQKEAEIKQFSRFVPDQNFLAHHCNNSVVELLGANTDLALYSDYSASLVTKNFQRNPNCWAASLVNQMTCVIAWNSNHTRHKSGTLITKRHMVNATHYNYPVGTNVIFVGPNNEVVYRTVVGRRQSQSYDITVYLLDEDLPEFILPCKILPADFGNRFPTGWQNVAAIGNDQFQELSVADLAIVHHLALDESRFLYPIPAIKQPYHKSRVAGGSGTPMFLLIGGSLVLCSVLYSASGTQFAGTFPTNFIAYINDFILELDQEASISTGYTLTEVDLSGFYPII